MKKKVLKIVQITALIYIGFLIKKLELLKIETGSNSVDTELKHNKPDNNTRFFTSNTIKLK